MLKDCNAVTPVRLEPATSRSRVKHSTIEPLHSLFTPYFQVSSANNVSKQFGPRSGWTIRWAYSGYKLFDTLMVILKDLFFKKVILDKNQHTAKRHTKVTSMRSAYICMVD